MAKQLHPRELSDIGKLFPSDLACLDYLSRIRWRYKFACGRCSHNHFWKSKRARRICQKCKYQMSPTHGTLFENIKTPLPVWFKTIWTMMNGDGGITSKSLYAQEQLGSYETALILQNKIRPQLHRLRSEPLVGNIDLGLIPAGELFKANSGFIAIAITTSNYPDFKGEARLDHIHPLGISVNDFFRNNIGIGTTISAMVHPHLQPLGSKYRINFVKNVGRQRQLKRTEDLFTELRLWISAQHFTRVTSEYLAGYLHEFEYRRNNPNEGAAQHRFRDFMYAIFP